MKKSSDSMHGQDLAKTQHCGLLRRTAAMVYDGLLLIAIWMIAATVVILPLDGAVAPGNTLFQLYLMLIAWIYFAICWRKGQTLGMKAWRIRLIAPQPRVGWVTTVVRFSVAIASLFCFGLGFLWSLFHPRRATWHDLASGTFLITTTRSKERA